MTTTLLAYIPSPPQGVWHLGFLPIRAYALCIITGIVAALLIGDRRWVARGGQSGVIYDIALWAVPFGLIGGRLYHVMTDWPTYFGDNGAGFVAALKIWDGGLGIWGAVALGGVGAWIACRLRGIPLPAFGDAIAPGIVLAQAIGRLGNYFNQELWGRETTLPWGLEIYERRDASGALDTLNGVSTGQLIGVVHPTFLYELLWNLLVFALLIWVDRRYKFGHGRLFALYVAAYCVGRFWIELMRSDHATEFGGIRVNSFTSTFVFLAAVIYIMVATKGREDPETLAGNEVDEDSTDPKDSKDSLIDKVAVDVAAVAAGSGIVAAAVVADRDDAAGKDEAAKSETADTETEGLGSVEGDDVAGAVESAPEVHAAALEKAEVAEDVEADAVAGADAAEDAEGADKAEPEAEPEAEPVVEPQPDSAVEPEAGLGSVEGEDVAVAVDDASEVHAAAVDNAEEAEGLEADVAGNAAEAEPEVESGEGHPVETADEAEELEFDVADEDGSETDGLGSVEGEDVAAAVDDASEVHAVAVDNAEEAEELESDAAADADEADDALPDADSKAEPEAEPEHDAKVAPEEGLGSVDGGEASAAVAAAPKIHAAAAKGSTEAEALSSEVEAEQETKDVDPE